MRAPEVLALLKAREATARDAFMLVRKAEASLFGGQTRHQYTVLQSKSSWLAARLSLAEYLAKTRQDDPGPD